MTREDFNISNGRKETAVFAAGCFWGVEAAFAKAPGVVDAEVGYAGGSVDNPTYKQVSGGNTGHAEAVRVIFDPEATSYRQLLELFFSIHDPTTLDRQGPDVGKQYRSAIFYKTAAQRQEAEDYVKELETKKAFPKKIVTEIAAVKDFWRAEEYHQRYLEKMGSGVCH